MRRQRTISQSISWTGRGVHTGATCTVTVSPAGVDAGLLWRSTAHPDTDIISDLSSVVSTVRSTDIGSGEVVIRTVEHLLSALHALSVTNARIEVEGPEVPILDGGSITFYQDMEPLVVEQQGTVLSWAPQEVITFEHEDTGATCTVEPSDRLDINVLLDYGDDFIGDPTARFVEGDVYATEIAPSRTFVRSHMVPQLIESGHILGGDLDCAVVIYTAQTDDGRLVSALKSITTEAEARSIVTKIKAGNQMKFDNEPARHKILDLYGDLYLMNVFLKAKISVTMPGHTSNIAFAKKLKQLISDAEKAR